MAEVLQNKAKRYKTSSEQHIVPRWQGGKCRTQQMPKHSSACMEVVAVELELQQLQLFWATPRKPSKAVGWSTFSWCFKPWPVQCSPYSSDHTNVTSQKEKVHVWFNLFFKFEIKMPGINMTYRQHPLQATQTSALLLSCSTLLFSQSTVSSICSPCIRSTLRGQGQWLLMLLRCAIQPNLGWMALWIRKHTKKHRGA